jgi:HAMP domain-containing protein
MAEPQRRGPDARHVLGVLVGVVVAIGIAVVARRRIRGRDPEIRGAVSEVADGQADRTPTDETDRLSPSPTAGPNPTPVAANASPPMRAGAERYAASGSPVR